MIAGLPGTGLAGLFFILSALAMPFVQVARAARGGPGRAWRLVVTHVGIAVGMVVAVDAAARLFRVLVGSPVAAAPPGRVAAPGLGMDGGLASFQVFGLPAVVVAIASLALLLVLSALLGQVARRLGPPPPPPPQPRTPDLDAELVLSTRA